MLKSKNVVLCFLLYKDKVLLTKRGLEDKYPKKWTGITGYIEENDSPYKTALKEIEEETKIKEKNLELLKKGKVVFVPDESIGIEWKVHPYLFKSKTKDVKLDEENDEYKWIDPTEIGEFDTVPMLKEIYEMF